MGCLPGGIKKDQLEDMIKVWQSSLDLDSCLGILENMNLLERSHEKLVLTPILIDYVSVNIENESKEKLIYTISEYYMELLKQFYEVNSTPKLDINDDPFFNYEKEIYNGTESSTENTPVTMNKYQLSRSDSNGS